MRPLPKAAYALVSAGSLLLGQGLHPLCGLPHITAIPVEAPVTLLKAPAQAPGDRTFKVRKDIFSAQAELIPIQFDSLYSGPGFRVYAETAEVEAGRVDAQTLANLVSAFVDEGRPGSIDPSLGIKALAEQIFGPPTDIDGNGQVFILLMDVRDDWDSTSSTSFIAGYFDPLDQGNGGNFADIIYLDTNPGATHTLLILEALAHEYQHLIHYGRDADEETWVNEGLSELSPVLMGLPHREYSYYLADTNVPMETFDGELADYARTGLFFLYSWVQLGTGFIQDLIGNRANGWPAFQGELYDYSDYSIDEFTYNWHVANFIDGSGIYGYGSRFSIPIPAMHETIVSFPQDDAGLSVALLGARWTMITGGRDLYLKAGGIGFGQGVELTLIRGDDSSLVAAPLMALTQTGWLDSTFGVDYQALFILATVPFSFNSSAKYDLYVSATGGVEEVVLSYDDSEIPDQPKFLQLGNGSASGEAVIEFTITGVGGELANVQFVPASSESLWVELYVGSSFMQQRIYKGGVTAPLAATLVTHWLPKDLVVAQGETVYVLLGSLGNGLAYNPDIAPIRSYLRLPGSTGFNLLNRYSVDGETLSGNWTIRLTYHRDGAGMTVEEIPPGVGHFYPNPFMAGAGSGGLVALPIFSPGRQVELTIFDLLGRRVYRHPGRPDDDHEPLLWNGFTDSGRPAPSGVYLARLRIGNTRVTRKLVLLR